MRARKGLTAAHAARKDGAMKYRKLGSSGIEVSVVGLGCWQFSAAGWKGVTDENSVAAVHAALDLGINLFDTAEGYGDGKSEEVLGEALKGRREKAVIATKVSHNHLRQDDLARSLDASLKRLGTDHVDLYQVHWPTKRIPIEETMEAMLRAKEAGKIRAIGVSNFDREQLAKALECGPVDSLQPPYSLYWRFIEADVLPLCVERNVAVLCYAPLAQGLLTGRYRPETPLETGTARSQNFLFKNREVYLKACEVAERIGGIAEKHGATTAQVSLAWLLSRPGVTSVLAGTRTPEHIRDSAGTAEVELSEEELDRIDGWGREVTDIMGNPRVMWGWWPDKHLEKEA